MHTFSRAMTYIWTLEIACVFNILILQPYPKGTRNVYRFTNEDSNTPTVVAVDVQ